MRALFGKCINSQGGLHRKTHCSWVLFICRRPAVETTPEEQIRYWLHCLESACKLADDAGAALGRRTCPLLSPEVKLSWIMKGLLA